MTEPLSREQLVDMLLRARTEIECEMALKLADSYLKRHPDDFDLRMMLEGPVLIIDAFKSGLLT